MSTANLPAVVDNKETAKVVDINSAKTDDSKAKEEKQDNGIKTKFLDLPFLYDLMSVPTYSRNEYRMQMYIINWARSRQIEVSMDKKGNLYLRKGVLGENEYYPCVTSHMDTVQEKSKVYAEAGARLDIKTREKTLYTEKDKKFYGGDVKHEIYIDGMGIGADDKGGVFISLSLMEKFDKMKAAFFVEEEVGMMGSKDMDAHFFDDCGYCIGWDSPELNRAAWKASGTRLFSMEFYEDYIKEVCDEWGMTDFRSEPFTDIINIREKTGLMCMNFGNGGYDPHMYSEYSVIEDMDHALGMGIALVEKLGNKLYKSIGTTSTVSNYMLGKFKEETDPNNNLKKSDTNDDALLSKEFNTYTYSSYNNNNNYYSSANSNSSTNTSTSKSAEADIATLKYIADTYDTYVENIKNELTEKLKKFCETNGLDYDSALSSMNETFSKEIKF